MCAWVYPARSTHTHVYRNRLPTHLVRQPEEPADSWENRGQVGSRRDHQASSTRGEHRDQARSTDQPADPWYEASRWQTRRYLPGGRPRQGARC